MDDGEAARARAAAGGGGERAGAAPGRGRAPRGPGRARGRRCVTWRAALACAAALAAAAALSAFQLGASLGGPADPPGGPAAPSSEPVSGRLAAAWLREWAAPPGEAPDAAAPRFRMQLMSDIHLEFPGVYEEFPRFEAAAPVLALAGDIGSPRAPAREDGAPGGGVSAYERFLLEQSERFEHVLLVHGNHELYSSVASVAERAIRSICDRVPRRNVHYLNRGVWEDPATGVRVIGATLWSHVPPQHERYIAQMMNDFRYIYVAPPPEQLADALRRHPEVAARHAAARAARVAGGGAGGDAPPDEAEADAPAFVVPLTVEVTNRWHALDVAHIRAETARAAADGRDAVVLTHHAPYMHGTATPLEESDPLNHALSTDLHELMGGSMRAWCFGHTHVSTDQLLRGTRVVSNQVGYMHLGEHLPPAKRTAEQTLRMDESQPGYDDPNGTYSFKHSHVPQGFPPERPPRVFFDPEFVVDFQVRARP